MSKRTFTLIKGYAYKCPQCLNDTKFIGRSEQCAEDLCEVWIECVCGFDPTANNTGLRMESVMGQLSKEAIWESVENCWNNPIATWACKT